MLIIEASELDDGITLRELADRNYLLEFMCTKCRMRQQLDLKQLIVTHGGKTRLGYIRRTTRCHLCE